MKPRIIRRLSGVKVTEKTLIDGFYKTKLNHSVLCIRSVIVSPVAKLPKVLKTRCSVSYEVDDDNNDDEELYLTESDIELLQEAFEEWTSNNKKHPQKKDFGPIKKYLQCIKDQMVHYRKAD